MDVMVWDGQLLWRFAQSGSEDAFAELVNRHGKMVYGTCLRITGSPQMAEDAAQAVFLVLARKAVALSSRREIGGWLQRTAENIARSLKHSDARRQRREKESAAMRIQDANHAEQNQALWEAVDAELARLSEKERQVVVGLYLESRTQRELATALGIPEGTVAWRSTTALERLRKRLCRRGLAFSASALAQFLSQLSAPGKLPAVFSSLPAAAKDFLAHGSMAAGHSTAVSTAEGALKMMFWLKVKLATLVAAMVLTLSGVAGGIVVTLCASEESTDSAAPAAQSLIARATCQPQPAYAALRKSAHGAPVDSLASEFRPTLLKHYWILLDGSQSQAPKDSTFRWQQVAGTDLKLPAEQLCSEKLGLRIYEPGEYKFSLVVTHGKTASQPAIVELNVLPNPQAGANQKQPLAPPEATVSPGAQERGTDVQDAKLTVSLGIYSGRLDPQWEITDPEQAEQLRRASKNWPLSTRVANEFPIGGFRGFRVAGLKENDKQIYVRIYKGLIEVQREDEQQPRYFEDKHGLEKMLIASAKDQNLDKWEKDVLLKHAAELEQALKAEQKQSGATKTE